MCIGVVCMSSIDLMVELPRGNPIWSGIFGWNFVSKVSNVDILEILSWEFS